MANKSTKENVATRLNGEKMFRVKVAPIRGKANNTNILVGWFPRNWSIPRDVEVVLPQCAVEMLEEKKDEIILYCEEVKEPKSKVEE